MFGNQAPVQNFPPQFDVQAGSLQSVWIFALNAPFVME